MVDSRGVLAQDGRRAERLELRVPITPMQLPAVRAMAGDLAIRMDYDLDSVEDLRLAVDEACATLAVVVEEMIPREDRPEGKPLMDVRVNVFVERSSQKAIVIGRGGSRLRDVGATAREGIEKLLGQRIHLDLHVKVAKDWQRDPKQLQRLGF